MTRFFACILALLLSFAAQAQPLTCPFATTTTPGCVKADGSTITVSPTGTITATTSGSGNVVGPASAVANNIPNYSGTTGKLIADSGIATSNVQLITGLASPAAIGNTTPNSGAFTTLSATGQITSTLAIGTAPFIITSTTQVLNLNASQLVGGTWVSPGTIGSTTPTTGAFTNLASSGTVSGNGFSNYLASPPAIGGTSPAAGTFTALAGTSINSGGAITRSLPNEGSTGTTQFLLAKLTGAGTAIKATTSDTGGVIVGAVQSASAITGNAQIAVAGQATCTFDGATTQDDFVQVSTTAAGDCHDTGSASFPTTNGQVLGRVLSTHGAGGNFVMDAFSPGIVPSSGGAASLVFTDQSKTTGYNLNSTTDVGNHFDNLGATASVNFNLPAGSNGLNYCFANLVASQPITITAPVGVKIAVGEVNSGAAGILGLPNQFDTICVKFQSGLQWLAYNGTGTWSIQ